MNEEFWTVGWAKEALSTFFTLFDTKMNSELYCKLVKINSSQLNHLNAAYILEQLQASAIPFLLSVSPHMHSYFLFPGISLPLSFPRALSLTWPVCLSRH